MKKQTNKSVGAFNQDAVEHQGYLYSTNAPLSSQIANKRLSDLTLENVDLRDKTVLDIGGGDVWEQRGAGGDQPGERRTVRGDRS